MKCRFLPWCLCMLMLAACSRSGRDVNWTEKLKPFTEGMDAAALLAELERGGYPCRSFPGYSDGTHHSIYFLPDGDVHLATQPGPSNQIVTISKPFFVMSGRTVEKRVSIWEQQFK